MTTSTNTILSQTLRNATLFAGAALLAATSGLAQTNTELPSGNEGSLKGPEPETDVKAVMREVRGLIEEGEPSQSFHEILSNGEVVARHDIYIRHDGPEARAAIDELMKDYVLIEKGAAGGQPVLRNVPAPELDAPPSEQPASVFWDPQEGIAVVSRTVDSRASLSARYRCGASVDLKHSRYGYQGHCYWYFWYVANVCTAVVSADRYSSADPDLSLYYNTGGGNILLTSSNYSNVQDDVGGIRTDCGSLWWAIKVFMYNGGHYSLAVHTFHPLQ